MKFKSIIMTSVFLSLVLSGSLFVPDAVFAETSSELQAQLDDAKSKLDGIYSKANDASEALNGTKMKLANTEAKIEDAKAQIEKKQQELKVAQASLSKQVSASYKGGTTSFVSTLLGATSFEDFITRVTYASRISQVQADNIRQVQALQTELVQTKAQLEQQKAQQLQLLQDQEQQKRELDTEVNKAEEYVNSLDSQVKEKLTEEQAAAKAEAEAKAKVEAETLTRQQAMQQQAASQNSVGNSSSNSNSNSNSNSGSNSSNNGNSSNSGSSTNSGSPSQPTSTQRQKIVAAALSMIGGTYVYGSYSPGSRTFDCSGLVMYCYAQVGISLDHYSESQGAYCTKSATVANAQPGDIVWRRNHVGIYIGNGVTVEAHSPAEGIGYGSLSRFSRVGSPLD